MERLTVMERARFMGNVTKGEGSDTCWHWIGRLDRDRYGIFWFRRKNRRAHRVAYWAFVGDIEDGMVVDHACEGRDCVNPAHLRCITARENSLLGNGTPALNSRKTACPRGHTYDRHYGKQRYCSICEKAKRARLRKKWAAEDTVAC